MWAGSPVSGCTSTAPTSSCWAGRFQLVRCGAFTCFSSTSKSGILPKMSTVLKSGRGGRGKKKNPWKNKSRKKKIRAEGSRPDGQVDFLLDFCLAERKSIFKVYCFTSSDADRCGKAEVPGSGTYSQRRCVCTQASAEQRQFKPQIFHSCQGGSVGTALGMAGNWRRSRRLFAFPSQHTHHCLLIYMTNALCYPLFAQWFRHSQLELPFHHPGPMFMKKKRRGWCRKEKKLSSPGCLDPGHVFGWLCAC